MTAAERIQAKIQKLRAMHETYRKEAVDARSGTRLRSTYFDVCQATLTALPALLDVAEAAADRTFGWRTRLTTALQRLGEPDAG